MLLDRSSEFGAGGCGLLVLDDTRTSADHLGKRPERDPVAVREAATGVPQDTFGQPIDVLFELPREP